MASGVEDGATITLGRQPGEESPPAEPTPQPEPTPPAE